MMHLAALCTDSGAVQGSWMYLVGKFLSTGRYVLKGLEDKVRKVVILILFPFSVIQGMEGEEMKRKRESDRKVN